MRSEFNITIAAEDAGKRIDQIETLGVNRSQRIKYGIFAKDNQVFSGKTKVQAGEVWNITIEVPTLAHLEPWDMPLQVLYESKTWAVVKKPYGVSVHPSSSDKSSQTIVHALLHYFGENLAESYDEIDGVSIPKLGLVHRLDKTTSGLLLVAKNNATLAYFQKNWKKVHKFYIALVHGNPPAKGRIEGPLDRDRKDRTKMAVVPFGEGKPALTTFEKEESSRHYSLLNVELHTGRTHQIRVHLSSIGFPILGDTLYGGQESSRIMLHATRLVLPDPDQNGEYVEVCCEPPSEFRTKLV